MTSETMQHGHVNHRVNIGDVWDLRSRMPVASETPSAVLPMPPQLSVPTEMFSCRHENRGGIHARHTAETAMRPLQASIAGICGGLPYDELDDVIPY
ncbi:hypothetical protein [Brucella intermedia]|uniref:hypothetical protein n=1 Tax=Brucella intermedia TaxID=94625 RepID=UPI00178C7272|nr:hypothetical protein [Brucella intermedia]